MSYRACVLGKIDANHQRRTEAEALLEQLDARVVELTDGGMPADKAEIAASIEGVEKATEENVWAKSRRVRDAEVQVVNQQRIMKSNDPGRTLGEIFADVELSSKGYLSMLHDAMNKFLGEYDTKALGAFRNKAGLDDVLSELYGKKTGSRSAAGYQSAITEMYKLVTKIARANGVNMVDDIRYHAPQMHSAGKMGRAGQKVWVDHHLTEGVLDWDHMKHFNGGKVIPVEERGRVLNEVFDTITLDGLNKATFDYRANTSVAARLTQKRFLRYKTPEAWTKANEDFGDGSLADHLIEYMSAASRDLAQLHVLGPNPSVMKATLDNGADVRMNELIQGLDHKQKAKKLQKLSRQKGTADDIYGLVTGRLSKYDAGMVGDTLATIRTLIPGAFLGKAILSAVPGDIATMKHAAMFSGHTTMQPVKRYLQMMNPASKKHREFAKRSGVIQELVMANLTSAERFGGDPMGAKWARHLTEGAMRASGLSHHTQLARWATSMELFADYAANSKVAFKDLPFRERFERFGITEADWDIFRATDMAEFDGATFLRPRDLMKRTDIKFSEADTIFNKFAAYEHTFLELAVPTASIEGKAALVGNTRQGTLAGELARSAAMFKNFPITIMMKHWREGMQQASTAGKVKYFMTFIAGLTAMGALSEQMHSLSRGEDLQNMNPFENPKFYAKSLARGGGLSLFADFITADVNRYGDGFFENLVGPVASTLDEVTQATYGQVQKLMRGEDTDFGHHVAKLVRNYTPGSHTWYLDLVINSLFGEFVLEELDPDFQSKASRKINKMFDEGREYYWEPGQTAPSRAPDFGAALGG